MEIDEKELARKLTVMYDQIILVMQRLDESNILTKDEQDLVWALHKAWAELMISLRFAGDSNILRGGGEWPDGSSNLKGNRVYEAMR